LVFEKTLRIAKYYVHPLGSIIQKFYVTFHNYN